MAVDAFDGIFQLEVGVGLEQAADRDFAGAGIGMAGCEQGRDAHCLGGLGEVHPGLLAAQPDVAQDEVDLLAFEHFERLVEIVDRRDNIIAAIAEHILILERGQRFVLDNEDAIDQLLTPAEQHSNDPKHDNNPETNKSATSAEAPRRPS